MTYKFELDDEQVEKIKKWDDNHKKTCRFGDPLNQGAIGGRLSYCFTPTSLGEIQLVKCACGEELDLTEYKDW